MLINLFKFVLFFAFFLKSIQCISHNENSENNNNFTLETNSILTNNEPSSSSQIISRKLLKEGEEEKSFQYAVVIDAGSTGSRVHIYRYKPHKNNPLIDIDFHNEKYQKFRPGLSSFENDPLNAGKNYLDPLLNFARQHVPFSYRKLTPLYLLASAGMRKLKQRNEKIANNIMDIVYKYLKSSEFMVKSSSWVRIIEGQDEGLWGWITANYLNGEIQKAVAYKSVFSANTKGVLEMGGESLQITFIPPKSLVKTANNQAFISRVIGGVTFPIFTHSYMGIGMEAAQTKFDTYLETKIRQNELSPCYLRGDRHESSTVSEVTGQKITWNGNGNFEECYKHLSNLIDKIECPKIEELMCTPSGIQMPHIKSKIVNNNNNNNNNNEDNKLAFYYIENFYYTALVLGIDHINGNDFLKTLKTKGTEYCSLDKEVAQKTYSKASADEISKTCFCAAWLSVMLESGFDLQDFTQYEVVRDIHGVGIDWALGFLVEQSQEIEDQIGGDTKEDVYNIISFKISSRWIKYGLFLLIGILIGYYLAITGRCSILRILWIKLSKQFSDLTKTHAHSEPITYQKLKQYPI